MTEEAISKISPAVFVSLEPNAPVNIVLSHEK